MSKTTTMKRKKIPSSTLYHLRYDFGMTQQACADTLGVGYYTVHRKLNLHRVKTEECVDCGAPVHKTSTRCRGCSSIQHSQRISGENNPRWRDYRPRAKYVKCMSGRTGPYGFDFDDKLKTEIRTRDSYRCAVCRFTAKSVHHIDYDKKNSDPLNLIALCVPCHATTNSNRDYWQSELTKLLEIRLQTD